MKTVNRQEFCDRVVACVRHATPEEKDAIRQELEGHMEDHAAALTEVGYTGEEAEERAAAAMGNPEEIGAELNRAYPLGWLVLSRVSLMVAVLLCAIFLLTSPGLERVYDNLQARLNPRFDDFDGRTRYTYEREVDIRAEVGEDILRIYKVGLDVKQDGETGDVFLVFCNYNKNSLAYTPNALGLYVQTSVLKEPERHFDGGGTGGSGAYYRYLAKIPVSRADDAVELFYDRFGRRVRQEEERMGTGQTRVVRRINGEKWSESLYLTANEKAILLSKVSFHPLVGWNGGAVAVLDCDGLGDFQARAMTWRIGGEQFTRVIVYGRTKSPEAQGIRVEGHWNETDEQTRNLPEVKFSGGPKLWTDKDGWRYFYMEKRIPDTRNGEMAYPEWMTADLLDGAGNTLGRYKEDVMGDYMEFIPVEE